MMFKCNRSHAIWKALGMHEIIKPTFRPGSSGGEILEQVLCEKAFEKVVMGTVKASELILTGCWFIWWQRRSIVHQEEVQNISRTAASIGAAAVNYIRAANTKTVSNRKGGWIKPLSGVLADE